jgi:hypothetical protein
VNLEYDISYHQHCRLTLHSGRSVILEALHQWMTYAGWLEGVPSAWINDRKVASAVQEAEKHGVRGARHHLLPPPRRDYCRRPGDMAAAMSLRGEAPEWLPVVTCVGVFKDVFSARDKAKDQSYLAVVWYQDEFALPIAGPVLDQLRALDWEALATDVEI